MRKLFLLSHLFFFGFSFSIGQIDYSQNLWLAFQAKKNLKSNSLITFDGGFRTHNQFIQSPRTGLARIVIEHKIHTQFIGLGFANFIHFKSNFENVNPEFRPFIQYRTLITPKAKKISFWVRFRHEFRFFTRTEDLQNRSRIQLGSRTSLNDKNIMVVSTEQFLTFNENHLFEQRYQLGFQKVSNAHSLFIFYQLQFQNTYKGPQHIIGLTYQFEQL